MTERTEIKLARLEEKFDNSSRALEMIYAELRELKVLLEKTHDQAVKTNGRVTSLESCSIGFWIKQNPVRFAGIVLICFLFISSLYVYEVRSFVIETIIKLVI